jgi:hypothetical protein
MFHTRFNEEKNSFEASYSMNIQYLVIPDSSPLPEPYIVQVPVMGDEDGRPLPLTLYQDVLTIPVRRDDPRVSV